MNALTVALTALAALWLCEAIVYWIGFRRECKSSS